MRPTRLAPFLAVVALACTPDDTKDGSAPATDSGASGVDTAEDAAPRADPAETGSYRAATRADAITTSSGQPLTVQTWYPAAGDATGEIHAYDGLLAMTALDGAAPVCDAPRPVLVFSHGNSGLRYQSVFLTEHLATRGWVVVAPDHEGNTAFDMDTARWGELAVRRPLDLSQTFDWLTTELAAPGGPLDGCVDPAAGFAVAGHSFGGYTAVAITSATLTAEHAAACGRGWLCAETAAYLEGQDTASVDVRDDRVWASVAMTPAAFELLEPSLSSSTTPSLVFGGTFDDLTTVEDQVRPIYTGLGARPKHLAVLETAGHYTFSDACSLLPSYPDCGGDYLDIPTAHVLIRGSTTAFLESWAGLEVDTSAWLPPDDPIVAWESVE